MDNMDTIISLNQLHSLNFIRKPIKTTDFQKKNSFKLTNLSSLISACKPLCSNFRNGMQLIDRIFFFNHCYLKQKKITLAFPLVENSEKECLSQGKGYCSEIIRISLHKKCFPLRISSVSVTKSAVSFGFGKIY